MEGPSEDHRINATVVESMPGYSDLVTRGYAVIFSALRDCDTCGFELSKRTLLDNAHITWTEIGLFCMCAVLWTMLRRGLTACLFKPFAEWSGLMPGEATKMPESAWKLMFYTMSWSYSTYLLFFAHYSFFHDPLSVFHDWKSGMTVPGDIAIAYLIQGSFYGHSIYATLYMDAWRKDSIVMVVHHIITMALIIFSYAFRYHNIGVLVLFLHDLNDIQLEFTKLNIYFKTRGGGFHAINDFLSTVSFTSFGVTWFWFRLYWFPLKVLYASIISSLETVPNIPFYFFFNFLLFALLLMNVYWFWFILLCMVRALTGQSMGVNDAREYEEGGGTSEVAAAGTDRPKSEKEGKRTKNGITKEKDL